MVDLAFFAQTRRIQQDEFHAEFIEVRVDSVAGCSRDVGHNALFLFEEGIGQGGFTYVGSPDDGQFGETIPRIFCAFSFEGIGDVLDQCVQYFARTTSIDAGHANRFSQA